MKPTSFFEFHVAPLIGGLKQIEVMGEGYLGSVDHGKGFDASSVGLAPVEHSDRLLKIVKEWDTRSRIPWETDTSMVLCDIFYYADSIAGFGKEKEYELSPRKVLKNALGKAREIGYEFKTSVEKEFFLLLESDGKLVPSDDAPYFAGPPLDKCYHVRRELARTLVKSFNINTEYGHHEVAKGQHELSFRVGSAIEMADKVLISDYAAENFIASRLWPIDGVDRRLIFTTMPKVFPDQNGSGQHIHMSLADKNGKNAFVPKDKSKLLSDEARYFIGGLLHHAPGLTLLLAPTVNSYKRLRPGFEAPITYDPGYAYWNRTMMIRVPGISAEKSARMEIRMADNRIQPHLAFAALLQAGLHGIAEKMDPGKPANGVDAFHLDPKDVKFVPTRLDLAIKEFKRDSYLTKALGAEASSEYAQLKNKEWDAFNKNNEWDPIEVSPWEMERYLYAHNVNYLD